jgi:hypothetical protein
MPETAISRKGFYKMGKYGNEYKRVPRDLYPTIDPRPIAALSEIFDFAGQQIWEPAAGNGDMAMAMRQRGASVYCSDIEPRGFPLDCLFDFVSNEPVPTEIGNLITNPPLGDKGKLAEAFIEAWLRRQRLGMLALLLPCDFDSAVTRRKYFADCELFAVKLVLTPGRLVFFKRTDGEREAPRENWAWFQWKSERNGVPQIRYSRGGAA